MTDIFLLCTSSERMIANKIAYSLKEEGMEVHIAENHILGNTTEHLKSAFCFMPILSEQLFKAAILKKTYEIALEQHKSILPIHTIPYEEIEWTNISPKLSQLRWFDFTVEESQFANLNALKQYLTQFSGYLRRYTSLLYEANLWKQFGYKTYHLLPKNKIDQQIDWLKHVPQAQNIPQPTALQCAFILESRRNIENGIADVFLTSTDDESQVRQTVFHLQKRGISCIHSTLPYHTDLAVDRTIELSSVVIKLPTNMEKAVEKVESELRYAVSLNKKVFNVIESSDDIQDSEFQNIQLNEIDLTALFSDSPEKVHYIKNHTKLLHLARLWQQNGRPSAGLLYGHSLQFAEKWYAEGVQLTQREYRPIGLHEEFIEEASGKTAHVTPEVFIANAANDIPFAKKLNLQLQKEGKVTYWPYEKLQFTENTEEVIYHGIASSDIFVIVLSSHITKKNNYHKAVQYANRLHKKVIGVLVEEIDRMDFPAYLATIDFCSFVHGEDPFDEGMAQLLERLKSHQTYEQDFNKVHQWTMNWIEHHKEEEFLIPKNKIDDVEKWYHQAIAASRVPEPTALHLEYIEKSREHVSAQAKSEHKKLVVFRIALAVSAFLLLITLALLVNTFVQYNEIEDLLAETQEAKEEAEENERLLMYQLEENEILFDSLRGLDQFARLQKSERDSMIQEYLVARNYQQNLEEVNEVLNQENSFFKGEIEMAELLKELREKYKVNKNDKTILTTYYDVVMSRRLTPGHKAAIYSAVPTPDAKFVLTAGDDGKAKLLDIQNNRVKTFLQNRYNGAVYSAEFSPNRQQVLTASHDGSAIAWDVNTIKPITKYSCRNTVNHATFSPNGKWVLTSEKSGRVTLWDRKNGNQIQAYTHKEAVEMAVFSKNSRFIFTAGKDGIVRKWEVSKAKETVLMNVGTGLNSIALSPNGKELLLACNNQSAILLSTNGNRIATYRGHAGAVLHASFSKQGNRVVTASKDRTARVWQKNGNLLCVLGRNREHRGDITSAAFSGSANKVFTSSADRTVRMWFLSPNEVFEGDNLERFLEIGAQ